MSAASIQSSDQPDRRSKERSIMIMRVGLLEQSGKPFFCLVRNVSSTGISVKLYNPVPRPGEVAVRIADESPIDGKIVWINGNNAGIGFAQGVDPQTLMRLQQKLRPVRRRSLPRVKATSHAALHIGGRIIQAVLRDISSLGARVITSRSLEIGARASIRIPDLPEITGYVRWTECSESGLTFETPIPMQVISEWIDGRLRVSV